jgi:putative transposase
VTLREQSHMPAKRTLDKLGIRAPHLSMVRGLSCRVAESLADYRSRPDRVWNRIPDDVRGQIIDMALESAELSPPEIAARASEWLIRLTALGAGQVHCAA